MAAQVGEGMKVTPPRISLDAQCLCVACMQHPAALFVQELVEGHHKSFGMVSPQQPHSHRKLRSNRVCC